MHTAGNRPPKSVDRTLKGRAAVDPPVAETLERRRGTDDTGLALRPGKGHDGERCKNRARYPRSLNLAAHAATVASENRGIRHVPLIARRTQRLPPGYKT